MYNFKKELKGNKFILSHPNTDSFTNQRKEIIEVFEYENFRLINSISLVERSGDDRINFDSTGEYLITAAWAKHGISCFEIFTGKEIWNIKGKEVRNVQYVSTLYQSDDVVFIGFNSAPGILLNIRDGSITEKLNGVLRVFDSADSDIMIWGSNMKIEIVKNKLKKTIIKSLDLYTIPILDAIIINTHILLRYCFDKDFTCYSVTNDRIIGIKKQM